MYLKKDTKHIVNNIKKSIILFKRKVDKVRREVNPEEGQSQNQQIKIEKR
jgi:hypothetical protein